VVDAQKMAVVLSTSWGVFTATWMGCEPLRGIALWGNKEEYGDFADFACVLFCNGFCYA
jgi:hypothetical protein